MPDNLLNLYEITNRKELTGRYRLIAVEGYLGANSGDDDLVDRNLQSLSRLVGIHERQPVAVIRRNGTPHLAVPTDLQLTRSEYDLTPAVIRLHPLEQAYDFTLNSAASEESTVGMAFLRFHLNSPLFQDRRLWSGGSDAYFSKRPINYHQDHREVDVFSGFGFRLRRADNRLFLILRLQFKYAESSWLLERRTASEAREHLKMRHLLYHLGDQWYRMQLLDVLSSSIKEARFTPPSGEPTNVFDHTIMKAQQNPPPWIRSLRPDSAAIVYRYPNRSGTTYFAAAALAKLLLSTNDAPVHRLHHLAIKEPSPRFELMSKLIDEHFSGALFQPSVPIRISHHALRTQPKIFPMPRLEFGQGVQLTTGNEKGATPLRSLGRARMDLLLDPSAGFAVCGSFDSQYLIVPQSLNRSIAEDFNRRIENTIRNFAQRPYRMQVVVYQDQGTITLKQQVDSVIGGLAQAGASHGHGILILPGNAQADLHNIIKRRLKDSIQVQCVSAAKLAEFYGTSIRQGRGETVVIAERESRYTSYLRYTALGLMIVNRNWGWVLPDNTHYDAYIGFDVLENTAAFTFFYQGGRQCFVRMFESQQKEKLSRRQVRTIVSDGLRKDLSAVGRIGSLVLRRDGRLFETEWLGFKDAIDQLKREQLLASEMISGAVEVQKHTAAGLRLVTLESQELRNPTIGSAFELDDMEGIVCTTGFPFRLRGTANPLHVRVARGSLRLEAILEDTFRMSLLTWPVPDLCMRLSVDLKLCDDLLRSVAARADDDEAEYGADADSLMDAASA